MTPLLEVEGLRVRLGGAEVLRGVDLVVRPGERVALLGESGCGKSTVLRAVLRLLPPGGVVCGGTIRFAGTPLPPLPDASMAALRGREIGAVPQDARGSLNPVRSVGRQVADVLRRHGRARRGAARGRAIEALEAVRLPRAAALHDAFPFELSGGMCQRVAIALALAGEPRLLLLDEPTTGLDPDTRAGVMAMLHELCRARGMGVVLVTHDRRLAAGWCDRVVVMDGGRTVEGGAAAALPREPAPLPCPAAPVAVADGPALLEVEGLRKLFRPRGGLFRRGAPVRAVDGVSFRVRRGEGVGLVGESGCGKSTTALLVARLLDPDAGSIRFGATEVGACPAAGFARHALRRRIQMVFQDPADSLDPRWTAARAIAEPLLRFGGPRGAGLDARMRELAGLVGLPAELLGRRPHQLSVGQQARVGIARALAPGPELLVLDEPTASLDASAQAVVLELLAGLRRRLGLGFLLVSHDTEVVRRLCDRVLVMRAGRVAGDA